MTERYRVLKAADPNQLAFEVNQLIDQGWQPAGGMSVVFAGGFVGEPGGFQYYEYVQAMYLPTEDGWMHECPTNGKTWTKRGEECSWCGKREGAV